MERESSVVSNKYRDYLGKRFAIRSSGRTWLWFVDDPRRDGGAVGVAASESDAVAEACSLIEEMSNTEWRSPPATCGSRLTAFAPPERSATEICEIDLAERAMAAWQGVLSNLERYLISTKQAAA